MLTAFVEQMGGVLDGEKIASRQLFKPAARAEEISGMVLFLLSNEASFITATAYPVSGGWDI